jgi:FkbM family methyltransferase
MSCPSIQERSARGLGWTELVGPGQRRVQAGVPFPLAVGALLALGAIARRQYAPEPSYERILEPASSVGRRPVHWHNPRWQCCGSVAVLVLMGRAPVSSSCYDTCMCSPDTRWKSRLSRLVLWRVPYGFWAGLWLRGNLRLLNPAHPTAEQAFLERYNFTDKGVIDAGGFDGRMAWYFARHAQRVVTFEPNPHSQASIVALTGRNRCTNIELVPFVLGGECGEMEMITHGGADATGTFDSSIAASFDETSRYTVRMTTLDHYCSATDIRPDFIKIDVEGFELQVLHGAEDGRSSVRGAHIRNAWVTSVASRCDSALPSLGDGCVKAL